MSSDSLRRKGPPNARREVQSRQWPDLPAGHCRSPPRLPLHVIKGVTAMGTLPAAPAPTSSAQRLYGKEALAASVRWLRSVARSVGACHPEPTDSSDDPNAPHTSPKIPTDLSAAHKQFQADNANAKTYSPMVMRAAVVHGNITCHTASGVFRPRIDEDADSDGEEDECETMVEPLRQAAAQAPVRPTVKRRRRGEVLEKCERVLIDRDLWVPSNVTSQYRRREVQELQHLQPWSAMLPSDLRARSGLPPSEELRQKYMHAGHYVPRVDELRRLVAMQDAHSQRLTEIVGSQAAVHLGLRDVSARHAEAVWLAKYPSIMPTLGAALGAKCEGLDGLRREKLQSVRMYDLAEYYYKVWRTLNTEQAQAHYIQKCQDRKRDALKDQRRMDPKAPKMLPMSSVRSGQRPALVDALGDAAAAAALGVHPGSASSSPRAGSSSGTNGRNVRQRPDGWQPTAAANSGGLPSMHSGHSAAQTHQSIPAGTLQSSRQPSLAGSAPSNAGSKVSTVGPYMGQ